MLRYNIESLCGIFGRLLYFMIAYLEGSEFLGSEFSGSDFSGSEFSGSEFSESEFSASEFSGCCLSTWRDHNTF